MLHSIEFEIGPINNLSQCFLYCWPKRRRISNLAVKSLHFALPSVICACFCESFSRRKPFPDGKVVEFLQR
jgi:hypothetical protein